MLRKYFDAQEKANKFFKDNKEIFNKMSKILKQYTSNVFKRFQIYLLSNESR